jgi:hypothetical protein
MGECILHERPPQRCRARAFSVPGQLHLFPGNFNTSAKLHEEGRIHELDTACPGI